MAPLGGVFAGIDPDHGGIFHLGHHKDVRRGDASSEGGGHAVMARTHVDGPIWHVATDDPAPAAMRSG